MVSSVLNLYIIHYFYYFICLHCLLFVYLYMSIIFIMTIKPVAHSVQKHVYAIRIMAKNVNNNT